MRPLTFEGFLASYVRSLGGGDTLALTKLARRSRSEARLVEPLLLWAVVSGRSERLANLLQGQPALDQELDTLVELHEQGQLFDALRREDGRLRPEYTKVWRSFVARRDAHLRDAELKLRARERVLELEAAKNVSRYRMAEDLGLNHGNLYAFLAQGNPSKLSLDRVQELVEYLATA